MLPISLWIATYIRFRTTTWDLRELYLLATSLLSWLIASRILNIYSTKQENIRPHRFGATLVFFFMMTGFSFYTQKELNFSRVVLVLFTTLQYALPLIVTYFFNRLHLVSYSPLPRVIIGSGKFYNRLKENRKENERFYEIINQKELLPYMLKNSMELWVAFDTIKLSLNDYIIDLCRENGVRCNIVVDNRTVSNYHTSPSSKGKLLLFTPLNNRLDIKDNRIIKRLFDIVGASIGIVILSPILILIAIIIKLSDFKSPVFFKQTRTGYNKKKFDCYKFRSMRVFSKEVADSTQATKDDPRITMFGKFLRRYNLDELPQLINVLKGEMSLIGPRPHPVALEESAKFKEIVPDYLLRHFVVPGLTGWAQVNGWRGITDTNEKIQKRVEFDLWYVENWSLWLDIKIIWLTLFSKKSYTNAV